MKTVLVVLAVSVVTAFSQGTVTFNTGSSINAGAGARITMPEFLPGGVMTAGGYAPSGAAYSAQLYSAAGMVTDASALSPAGVRIPFRNGTQSGFVEARSTVTNPFTGVAINDQVAVTVSPGGPATVQVRAWDSAFATYEDAVAANGVFGTTPLLFLASTGVGGPGGTPGVLLNGLNGSILIVPEPSILAFAALNLGLLLFRRLK